MRLSKEEVGINKVSEQNVLKIKIGLAIVMMVALTGCWGYVGGGSRRPRSSASDAPTVDL